MKSVKFETNEGVNQGLVPWNRAKGKTFGPFVNGEYETEDAEEIAILDRISDVYHADGSPPVEAEEVVEADVNLEDMSIKQLKEYAKAEEISLKGAKTKAEIVKAIQAEIEAEPTED